MERLGGGLAAGQGQPSMPTTHRAPCVHLKAIAFSKPLAVLCKCYGTTVTMVLFSNTWQLETQKRQEGGRYYSKAFERQLS